MSLEKKTDKFDVVKLQRRSSAPYFPVHRLTGAHSLGRLKYYDRSGDGYVVTRRVAAYLLERFSVTHREIDQVIPRFWDNGLRNVLYVNPPVVSHDETLPSYIEGKRLRARVQHRALLRRSPAVMTRRTYACSERAIRRWGIFRELRRQDRDIDPFR